MTNQLANAQQLALAHPDTFAAPELNSLRDDIRLAIANDIPVYVKVCFTNPGERIWVQVKSDDGVHLHGTLANTPAFLDANFGDPVELEYHNIYDLLIR